MKQVKITPTVEIGHIARSNCYVVYVLNEEGDIVATIDCQGIKIERTNIQNTEATITLLDKDGRTIADIDMLREVIDVKEDISTIVDMECLPFLNFAEAGEVRALSKLLVQVVDEISKQCKDKIDTKKLVSRVLRQTEVF